MKIEHIKGGIYTRDEVYINKTQVTDGITYKMLEDMPNKLAVEYFNIMFREHEKAVIVGDKKDYLYVLFCPKWTEDNELEDIPGVEKGATYQKDIVEFKNGYEVKDYISNKLYWEGMIWDE